MFSLLRLLDSQITSITYETDLEVMEEVLNEAENEDQDDIKKLTLGYDFIEVPSDSDTDFCQVGIALGVTVHPSGDDRVLLNCELKIRGRFSGEFFEGKTSAEKEAAFLSFGIKTLFDEARAYIALITTVSPYKKIVLPDLDVEQIIQDAEENSDAKKADGAK